ELEVPNPRPPVEAGVRRVVLLRVPVGAVVDRVDRHVAVVAPAAERVQLAAGAHEEGRLSLRQLARRITRQTSRVADLWMDSCRRSAEADRQVAAVVHGGASHPAPSRAPLVGPSLAEASPRAAAVV